MLLSIIDEMNNALDNNLYYAALTIALTIPDICAKAEYPNEKNNKKRYINWFDDHIGNYEKSPQREDGVTCPHISGEVIYSLRNSVLHQGTPNVETNKIKNANNRVDRFVLVKEPKNKYDIYLDFSSVSEERRGNSNNITSIKREYHLNIRRLCLLITHSSKKYYEDNKEKFDFFNFVLVNKEHEYDNILF